MPRDVARWSPQYHQIVLTTDPIAYWIQDEKQGGVSYDWVRRSQGSDQNGAYTGVTLGQPGIGDGRTSPFFDGANDFNNIFTPTFQGRFALTNHGAPGAVSESTVMAWARVAQPPADPWTDGNTHLLFRLLVDGNNLAQVYKTAANNRLQFYYSANGVIESINLDGIDTIEWMHLAITWSASAGVNGEMRGYFNGAQTGVTQVALGVWTGNLTIAVIGAQTLVPSNVWHGYLAHAAVWGRACPPAEITHLYNEAFR